MIITSQTKTHTSRSLIQGYLELFKPRPSLLLVYTGIAPYIYAAGTQGLLLAGLFLLLGFAAVMGANALNSFLDRDIDGKMRRTMNRPIPRGLVSPRTALILGSTLVAVATLGYSWLFNPLAGLLAFGGAAYYILFYTLYLKRRTYLSTVIGGFAGSFPALTGWAAAQGRLGLEAGLLALIVFLWTPGHFWSLAMRVRDEYLRVGVPSLPSVVDEYTAVKVIGGFNLATAAATLASIPFLPGIPYAATALLSALLLTAATLHLLRNPGVAAAWQTFKVSSPHLLLAFSGLLFPP
jgi:protoheme IX farnesyltransferase